MNKAALEESLAQCCRHVAAGKKRFARQRHIVAELESIGRETAAKDRRLLKLCKEVQTQQVRHRDLLRDELLAWATVNVFEIV